LSPGKGMSRETANKTGYNERKITNKMNTIDIQIIGNYNLHTEEHDDGGCSAYIVHPRTIKKPELDNKILNGTMVNGNLHLSRKGIAMLLYPAFPIELLEESCQIYVMDVDQNAEPVIAIKIEMTS